MWRSTPELVRVLRQRYEETDQLLTSIAAEFGLSERTLGRMRQAEGWRKRSDRINGLPIAVRLLEEAKALARQAPNKAPPTPPFAGPVIGPTREGRTRWLVEGGEQQPSAIDRVEALVLNEIAAAEAARAQVTDKRQLAKISDRNARTLATLTQTLRTLQQMRTGKSLEPEMTDDDDDMPRDIDEFRHALARRIEAFVASETDAEDADENSGTAVVDAAG